MNRPGLLSESPTESLTESPTGARANASTINLWKLGLAAFGTALVVACGGGDVGSGGTGVQPEQGTSVGTVTGFGSVIVDGVRFDDSAASVQIERSPGSAVREEIKLGHHVEMSFEGGTEGAGVARAIRIEPEVIGPVSGKTATTLTVLGQTITVNTVPANGPVTQFEPPASSLADIATGSLVEVHAILKRDAGGAVSLQATRIEGRSSIAALRASGIVTGLSGAGGLAQTFQIGALTVQVDPGVSILPSGKSLANGQAVVVFGDTATGLSGTTLTANSVRIKSRSNDASIEDYVAGVISNFIANTSFDLNGVHVTFSASTPIEGGALTGANANGQYVRVRGKFAADNSYAATRIKLRSASDEFEVELHGSIVGLVGTTFSVRDVLVDGSGVTVEFRRCPGKTQLEEGMLVEVEGQGTATGMRATSIKCEDGSASGGGGGGGLKVQRVGTLTAVNLSAKQFTFDTTVNGEAPLTVQWTDSTFFREMSVADLTVNARLEVEGTLSGTTLTATKIKEKS